MKTILVADDKESVRTLVREVLEAEGFKVATANNGSQALSVAEQIKPSLILLDIMMPEMNGYEFIRAYRKQHETPIILLTAKMEETDKVLGLELGADDYITKPFGMKELVARINAVLRRGSAAIPAAQRSLSISGLVIDVETHSVTSHGTQANLTPSEFDLLHILASNPGRVYSRADLLLKLQGTDYENVERTIDVHIRNLRSKIELDPANPTLIETVFGVGYRFKRP
jgi:DNA-binding response OmpR family regulator